MRLEGKFKMGYYPTPDHLVPVIASFVVPAPEGTRGRLLDPCAGEGRAAAFLGQAWNCETWGVELSDTRAAKAAQVLDKVLNTAWPHGVSMSPLSVSVLFLNPPYDWDGKGGRLEVSFLKSATLKLMEGGVLVYIVPEHVLQRRAALNALAAYYTDVRVYRFPPEDYGVFKQVVLFARRIARRQDAEIPAAIDAIHATVANPSVLEPAPEPLYTVLPAPSRDFRGRPIRFHRADLTDVEKVELTRRRGVRSTRAWDDLWAPLRRNEVEALRPAMPLKKGHVAMLMAAGLMGNLRLDGPNGPMVVKGTVAKKVEKTVEREQDARGRSVKVERYRDRYQTTVTALHADGTLEVIQDVDGLRRFMAEHGERIARHILETYKPLYNLDPTPEEMAVVNRLGHNRQPLPGQKRAGLLPVQKHAAIALARAAREYGAALIQGEMGLGKTTVALASLELLDAYPAIVICPPHLVPKWIREIQEVIPGAVAVELKRIGRNGEGEVNDVRRFLEDYESGKLPRKAVAVVASTSAKLGSGWEPAVVPTVLRKRDAKGKVQEIHAFRCPECGQVIRDKNGVPVTDIEYFKKHRRTCQNFVSGWQLDWKGRRVYDEEGNPVWGQRRCNAPLYQYQGVRRWPIADYIRKHAKGKFKMLIADEVHQYKAKASDRGIAFAHLVGATKYTLALTGTFFGGPSTSIFWLLHRMSPEVRRDYGFHDEKRWVLHYGVMEAVRRLYGDEADGVYSGNRRYRNEARERPGISPAVIKRLLHNTVFLSLKDLGVALPPYEEDLNVLMMGEAQAGQYARMESALRNLAVKDTRYLSLWLQWALARPNSAFRDEQVIFRDRKTGQEKVLFPLPRVVDGEEVLPKEAWLAEFCEKEKARGRKVIVYLRQTGTRDIQYRIKEVLEARGLRVTVLTSSVNPRKREAWIAKRVRDTDVLVVNPKLVETGLDLVDFATIVFYEIEYSLYTLWQAMRRVYRLGQRRPVKVVFVTYAGAMEEQALALIGRKMQAAQMLYGDDVGGAIVPVDDGDILTELAKSVLEGAELPKLETLLGAYVPEEAEGGVSQWAESEEEVVEAPALEEEPVPALAGPGAATPAEPVPAGTKPQLVFGQITLAELAARLGANGKAKRRNGKTNGKAKPEPDIEDLEDLPLFAFAVVVEPEVQADEEAVQLALW